MKNTSCCNKLKLFYDHLRVAILLHAYQTKSNLQEIENKCVANADFTKTLTSKSTHSIVGIYILMFYNIYPGCLVNF